MTHKIVTVDFFCVHVFVCINAASTTCLCTVMSNDLKLLLCNILIIVNHNAQGALNSLLICACN